MGKHGILSVTNWALDKNLVSRKKNAYNQSSSMLLFRSGGARFTTFIQSLKAYGLNPHDDPGETVFAPEANAGNAAETPFYGRLGDRKMRLKCS